MRTAIIEEFTVSAENFGALVYQIGQNYPLLIYYTQFAHDILTACL